MPLATLPQFLGCLVLLTWPDAVPPAASLERPSAPLRIAMEGPSEPPAAEPALSPTLARYEQLWKAWDSEKARSLGFVYPLKAKLRVDDNPALGVSREALVAWLRDMQPDIRTLIQLSEMPMGDFPPEVIHLEGAEPDAHLAHPRAWMLNFSRLLLADASRAWEDGDSSGALERVAAAVRLGHGMIGQRELLPRLSGAGVLGSAVRKALVLIDAGVLEDAAPEAVEPLRRAALLINPADPTRFLAEWEIDARRESLAVREWLSGDDAASLLADYLEEHGTEPGDLSSQTNDEALNKYLREDPVLQLLEAASPQRSAAPVARRLSTREIRARLNAAEALIPLIGAALRGEATATELEAALQQVQEDPSNIARLIIGPAESHRASNERLKALVLQLYEKLGIER